MKKALSALLLSGIIFGGAATTFANGFDDPMEGRTTLEIRDFSVDETTGLPSNPGYFTLDSVPTYDFGVKSLNEVVRQNATLGVQRVTGDLTVTDTRPLEGGITDALAQIEKAKTLGKASDVDIKASETAWGAAVKASAWHVTAEATQLSGIGSSLTLNGGENIMGVETPINVFQEEADQPVGTKNYTDKVDQAELTIAKSNVALGEYEGKIFFRAINGL